ncbi:hypothetical protein [Nissabacter archeti]|uniref:hypothetical protein n=1 Tax=Nissabacter archeti TaxID=1917880 RepID=UPI000932B5C7|nr:hypothetical protein [Nissabacter archeti]
MNDKSRRLKTSLTLLQLFIAIVLIGHSSLRLSAPDTRYVDLLICLLAWVGTATALKAVWRAWCWYQGRETAL